MNSERYTFSRKPPSGIAPATSVWALGDLSTMPKGLEFLAYWLIIGCLLSSSIQAGPFAGSLPYLVISCPLTCERIY